MANDYVNRWDSIKSEAVVFRIFTARQEQQSGLYQYPPDVSFTRGVLQKLMYFCDFDYYEATGKYLTRETYVHGRNGPIPIHFDMVMDELITDERIEKTADGGYLLRANPFLSKDCRELNDLDLKCDVDGLRDLAYHTLPELNRQQRSVIDRVVARYSDLKPSELESVCKKEGSWIIVKDGQMMDYDVVFYRGDDDERADRVLLA